ncbi:carboxylesterase type B [Amycolatopsis jiangsuensis]|uniref:Carboxylic ester hydrolase n=1 Tax=Amycolatopsis jiangsuensis TaxID=1181879 RepID=A0A840IPM4_9PSEU|nr:carboxylesterase type B [Amycolatopsis jiangsuensis]
MNVTTPDPGRSGLPVMVWIHGSAFQVGSNTLATFDGAACLARRGVVVVAINYRLGAPGFAEIDGAPSNRGIRDQIAALEWVHENIHAFGGDPANVTVFGTSAGGVSAALLFASPRAEGLFHRVIVQSGGGGTMVAEPEDARRVSRDWSRRLGVEPDAATLGGTAREDLIAAQLATIHDFENDPAPTRWGSSTVARS